ncbi:MAG: lysophospholipid acyltransferase family protein [Pseudomonadales bacterium]|jgi:KDO2-lipid IV(A) lauroyltransferase|nr:lysophospholipid acyltransferase family protein [Pseudomonadales bacterium]
MSSIYVLPRRLAGRDWTRSFAQAIEARMLASMAAKLQRVPLEQAMARSRAAFTRLGARSAAHRDLVANLAVLHPGESSAQLQLRARRTWGWLGATFAEVVHVRDISVSLDQRVELVVSPEVDAFLRAPGRAGVFATAHVGPWLLSNLIAARYGFPLTATVPSSANARIDRMLRQMLRALPVAQVTNEEGYEPLSAQLDKGHKVSLAVDGWNDEGHAVKMFGERMRLDPTAAMLAARHDCPMLPIHTQRLPEGRYRVVAERILWPDTTLGSVTERARTLTEAFAVDFEQWIDEAPGQWLCLTPRWAEETVWGALTRAMELTQQTASDHTVRLQDVTVAQGLVAGARPAAR